MSQCQLGDIIVSGSATCGSGHFGFELASAGVECLQCHRCCPCYTETKAGLWGALANRCSLSATEGYVWYVSER